MTPVEPKKWLLLIHQIPPKPDALRVKIWRRLQQVGAVAIKQSVYAMPLTEQSREDLSWILKEIVHGGGDGSISEAHFVEGMTDEKLISLFQNARRLDYEKIAHEAAQLVADWSSKKNDSYETGMKAPAQASKLRRRLDEVAAIDFFQTPERGTAEILIRDLAAYLSAQPSGKSHVKKDLESLKGKTWVTRKNLFVDRIACGWLIRRFVDQSAVFRYIADSRYSPKPGEIRFDMFEGEYTHQGDCCTFEIMVQRLQIEDRALVFMAEIVHDIDLKDVKFGRLETDGFSALLTGLAASLPDDDGRMREGMRLFDNLYAYFGTCKQ